MLICNALLLIFKNMKGIYNDWFLVGICLFKIALSVAFLSKADKNDGVRMLRIVLILD